jgi:hypothetical protein
MKFIIILFYFFITLMVLKIINNKYTVEKFIQFSKIKKKVTDPRCNKKLIAEAINRINQKIDTVKE